MGCDIHAIIERQIDGKWVCISTIKHHHARVRRETDATGFSSPAALSRNYDRFAALAGVRGDGPSSRGLPEDVSDTGRALADDCGVDGHSHSWLPLKEAVKIFTDTEHWGELKPDNWARLYPSNYFFDIDGEDTDQHRLVFWFDN